MGHILGLGGDLFAFIIIYRGYKLTRQGWNKMTETESDWKLRRVGGWIIVLIGIIAIILDHTVLA